MDAMASGGWMVRATALSANVFRFSMYRPGTEPGSGLNRYGFLRADWPPVAVNEHRSTNGVTLATSAGNLALGWDAGAATVRLGTAGGAEIFSGRVSPNPRAGGVVEFGLAEGERFFGLGDQTRDRIEHRGTKIDMWIINVRSYIPVPFVMSSRGYGLLVNTTFRHGWDLGKVRPDTGRVYLPAGNIDFYLILGGQPAELLDHYTQLTGRPALPPKWSFGLWFICRTQANDFEAVSNAREFRDRGIPCDVIGLEPGWMSTNYDLSVDKTWHDERFRVPPYNPQHNFISALKRMGFRLELWLCNDYDLSIEEERRLGRDVTKPDPGMKEFLADDAEQDTHFTEPVRFDKITKPDQPWFEHLKRFVDLGVDFFKQDGAFQVCEHPDRGWANGMSDTEMHNLYPLFYSRQMFEGFRAHTGRRPCCFTPAGWAGLQAYTGTWTGDTGGGPKTLIACLNLALSGHYLSTCDMDVADRRAIHYGFFMAWAQVNSWHYFRHPWLLGDELYPVFLGYARLRSRLVPYIYTYARQAHLTGLPIMRPMAIECPGDPSWDETLTQYFFGRELLISAFADQVRLPEGHWCDFWTGRWYTGPSEFAYAPPADRGGGCFVRANSIVPLGPVTDFVGQKTDEGLELRLYLREGGQAAFELYDDDGVSFDYERGRFTISRFEASCRDGVVEATAPVAVRVDRVAAWLESRPREMRFNGRTVPFTWDGASAVGEVRLG